MAVIRAALGSPFFLGKKMHIKYRLDYRKQDSITGVGLWWEPGQVRNVSPEVAGKLLCYTDTWESAEDPTVGPVDTEEVALKQDEKPVEEPLPVIDFHGMSKKELIDFAQTKYNEKIDKRMAVENVRHKVITLFSQHELEQG